MREALFILVVILVLLGLTAFRYRKAISGMIGFARMLKDAKQGLQGPAGKVLQREPERSAVLVNCDKCGVWVPQNKARKRGGLFYCSDECLGG